jgi:hypothetical protein
LKEALAQVPTAWKVVSVVAAILVAGAAGSTCSFDRRYVPRSEWATFERAHAAQEAEREARVQAVVNELASARGVLQAAQKDLDRMYDRVHGRLDKLKGSFQEMETE